MLANFSGAAITNNVVGATVFADTFDRADANPMSAVSSGGGTWGGDPSTCKIVSNQLLPVSGASFISTNLGSGDGWLQVDITVQTGAYNALCFRNQMGSDFADTMLYYILPDNLYLVSRTGAIDTVVDTTALALTPNTAHTFRVEFTGSSVVMKIDGTAALTSSTSAKSSQTYVGLMPYGYVLGGAYDNFSTGT